MTPIAVADVLAARDRIRPHIAATPLQSWPELDALVGSGIRLQFKPEHRQPTGSFKVRNGCAVVTALDDADRRRGLVAASRGNHGLGLAWAGTRLDAPVTICVPVGNNPEKNAGMRALGARLIEEGRDYDEATAVADRLVATEGMRLVHSTNEPLVLAGAGTIALEMLEEDPALDALVFAIGGGSQAVGAITVCRARAPRVRIWGVQAAGARALHDSWHAKSRMETPSAHTIADGIATRMTYDLTWPALRDGLAGVVTVEDAAIAAAVRALLTTTGDTVEPAGAAGLAGALALRDRLAGQRVGVVLSGGNIDPAVLRRIRSNDISSFTPR